MTKPKIFVTRAIPDEARALLKQHAAVEVHDRHVAIPRPLLLSRLKDADGLLCVLTDKVDAALLKRAPKLKAVATYSVGFDHIDVAACTARGVVVCNTPGVLTDSTADFTMALLLAAARRVVEGDRFMRAGKYKGWDPMMLLGTDVHGKTLGIVGFGRIGQAVARRAAGFGMRILYNDTQRLFPEVEKQYGAAFVELDELLRQSDFISLHTVLDKNTRGLIDASALGKMKPSAYLINAARGPIVDEKALVKALASGRIRGAALDVYDREPRTAPGLARLPNVVLAPHLASASLETRTQMGLMAAQGLLDALVKRVHPKHVVNPDVFDKIAL